MGDTKDLFLIANYTSYLESFKLPRMLDLLLQKSRVSRDWSGRGAGRTRLNGELRVRMSPRSGLKCCEELRIALSIASVPLNSPEIARGSC